MKNACCLCSCAANHNCCEFMSAAVLWNSEDMVLFLSSWPLAFTSKPPLPSSAIILAPCGKVVWYKCPFVDEQSIDIYSHVYFQTTCLQAHQVFYLFYFGSCTFYYSFILLSAKIHLITKLLTFFSVSLRCSLSLPKADIFNSWSESCTYQLLHGISFSS